jgi:hypothetical protein
MDEGQVRRWMAARRAAEGYERRLAGPAAEPGVCWRRTLSLFALLGRMIGWPVPPDDLRRREDASAADAWLRLREAYRRRP